MTFGEVSAKERKEVRRQLEEYCGLDTKGMVDILSALSEISVQGQRWLGWNVLAQAVLNTLPFRHPVVYRR